jgi:hypothetical protein
LVPMHSCPGLNRHQVASQSLSTHHSSAKPQLDASQETKAAGILSCDSFIYPNLPSAYLIQLHESTPSSFVAIGFRPKQLGLARYVDPAVPAMGSRAFDVSRTFVLKKYGYKGFNNLPKILLFE